MYFTFYCLKLPSVSSISTTLYSIWCFSTFPVGIFQTVRGFYKNSLSIIIIVDLKNSSYLLGSRGIPQNSEVRPDRRCGAQFPAQNGNPGKCDSRSDKYCCSEWGW